MAGTIELPPIRYSTYIDAVPQKVYDTLTTASGWDAWFTQGAEVDARSEGSILFRWVDFKVDHYSAENGGPVLEAIPPRPLPSTWRPLGRAPL